MQSNEIDLYLESRAKDRKSSALVYGIGKNDVRFCTSTRYMGKFVKHRAYESWRLMLKRCYCKNYQQKHPTYVGCTVNAEWLSFNNFYEWWKSNFVEGWQLDKDLLINGNREYGKNACLYVPKELNVFTIGRDSFRGEYPIGASYDKASGRFRAYIRVNSVYEYLGQFDSAYEAHCAWHERKVELAIEYKPLCDSIHTDLFDGLMFKVLSLKVKPEG